MSQASGDLYLTIGAYVLAAGFGLWLVGAGLLPLVVCVAALGVLRQVFRVFV